MVNDEFRWMGRKLGKEKDSYICVGLLSKGKMNKYKSQKKKKEVGGKGNNGSIILNRKMAYEEKNYLNSSSFNISGSNPCKY